MNYIKHYDVLVTRGKTRKLSDKYLERHHIIPKCLGGSDDIENISLLTPEEHYTAHLLLVKIYPNEKKLVFAAVMMNTTSKFHNDGIGKNFYQKNAKISRWCNWQHASLQN